MAHRKQRRRPYAGIEIAAETEHYTAVEFCDPAFPNYTVIQVYSKPHHDLIFRAFRGNLIFQCKRCRREHSLGWSDYFRELQADKSTPPYQVLCTQVDTWLVQADEHIPDHLKAYRIYTLTSDILEIIANIHAHLNITIDGEHSG